VPIATSVTGRAWGAVVDADERCAETPKVVESVVDEAVVI
jgi:hypothetical protein